MLVAAALFLDFRRYLPELPDYLGLLVLAIPVYVTAFLLLRRPSGAFALMWVFAVVAPVVEFSPRFGLLVPLYVGACRWPARTAQVALAACAIPIALGTSFFYLRLDDDLLDAPSGLDAWLYQYLAGDDIVLWIAVTVAAWGWGRLTLLSDLRLRDTQELHAALAVQEVQAERLRLARELHDNVGHALSAIIMQSAGVRTLVRQEDDQIRHSLDMIQDTGVMAMKDLHGVLGLLRSDGSPTLTAEGRSVDDLETLFDVARASGLVVDTSMTGTPLALGGETDLAAYRVVQESLTNVRKHAGSGAHVLVQVDWGQDHLTLTVTSSQGLPKASHDSPDVDMASLSARTGLIGLTQRLSLLGGHLHYGPTESGGFCVRADLPRTSPHGGRHDHGAA